MAGRIAVRHVRDGRVAEVAVDHDAKLNTLNPALMREFAAAFADLSREDGLRAVVLTGAGPRAFVGGADISVMVGIEGESQAQDFIRLVHGCCRAIRDCTVPVIARVNGWCLGAGLELAAACDFRIASGNAMFGMPEVRLGIPSVIEAALLPRLIGAGRARWLVLTGQTINAEEALRWGFLERVVPLQELDQAVDAVVAAILENHDGATRAQKRLQQAYEDLPLAEAVRISIDEFARSYASGEPREIIAAFRAQAKRPL